jgi:hypothetical protein
MSELEKQIGTKEPQKLTAGSVIVKAVEVLTKGEGKKKFKITELTVLHPDKEEPIKMSNMKLKKVQGNNETITKDGIWYREDVDGNIDKHCNTAELLRFYSKQSLGQLVNMSVTTELDAAGYLCIKAY